MRSGTRKQTAPAAGVRALGIISPMLSGVLAGGANRDPKAILDVIMRRNRTPQGSASTDKMAKGGKVGRGDGCCMKGKTKGMMK